MASYRGHLTFSTLLGASYGGIAAWKRGVPWPMAGVGGLLTAVGGLLPDLDSDSGVPVRELFGLAGAFLPLFLLREANVAGLTPEDAQHIAERLRNRLTNYLTGEGRDAIEARCRDALHEHSAWLVGQITREVALALETEVMDWVRDAVDEEIARRRAGHAG